MLEGRQFTVYTDHKPLSYAFSKNNVADALSRISEIKLDNSINYEEMALAQSADDELRVTRDSGGVLKMKSIVFTPDGTELWCDTSTEVVRPYVPKSLRKRVFDTIHNLSHPGVKASVDMIRKRFVWHSLAKDVAEWARSCMSCQKSKIHRHTKSETGVYPLPRARFSHVNVDIVGPLPPSRNQRYCLTCVDRYSRWAEVFPMPDQTANTVAETFFAGWVARFGVPDAIVTDRGGQFDGHLINSLAQFLGCEKARTTSYNPASNGMVERFHRQLKHAIKCHATERWVEVLPIILLGIRSSIKSDIGSSSAELVYGCALRLPGEFFRSNSAYVPPHHEFLKVLKENMAKMRPAPAARHGTKDTFVHKDLPNATHVFVRQDYVRKPLQQPYDGPYEVVKSGDKFFKLRVKDKEVNISINRLKPAQMLTGMDSDRELRPKLQVRFLLP
ncbi:retrovirus-like pol polyprotein [Lasius niger]|uniref:Retrovirus-like pol polyprotein n=1 Tax=Lasius niger TaxID=67767 RepID=A0A0J7JZK0_LASNI|nr:retrovirus-like pol polyprotein [Lasius niger]